MMPNQPFKAVTPLREFMDRHGLSLADLAKLLGYGGPSRSTMHRLVKNELAASLAVPLYKELVPVLQKFLFDAGHDKAAIDAELKPIFERGEYQPMISKRLELPGDAQQFFGLDGDPFSRPPESRDEVYVSKDFQRVIDRVIDAIRYQGFVFVEGEIGSGKSTLRALVVDHVMNHPNLDIAWPEFFDMGKVSPMQIATAVLEHFRVHVPGSAVRRGNAVKALLERQFKDGNRIAIGFDEVHRLPDTSLSSLKNFLEMSSGGFQRYLGVILFGQPLFTARLSDPRFREIVERLTVIPMPDFSKSAAEYLDHRLRLAGKALTDLFDEEAVDLICRQATTPLQIGNIANEALSISMRDFKNKKVIGSAIRTRMFFENRAQGFRLRKAS